MGGRRELEEQRLLGKMTKIENVFCVVFCFFFFKQKTAYEIVSRDWSSDVCSSDLNIVFDLGCMT